MRFRAPRNLGWKIGSLLLAVLLWAAMSLEPEVVVVRDAPVLYKNVPPDRVLAGDAPQSVRLELRGRPAELTTETLAGTSVVVDAAREMGTVSVSATQLNLPRGVSLLRSTPPQIQVNLSRLANKKVPVEIQFSGEVGAGNRLVSSHAMPDTLTLAGADSDLADVTKVQLEPIDLSALAASSQLQVRAREPRPQLYFISSPIVTVTLALGPVTNRSTQNDKEIR